ATRRHRLSPPCTSTTLFRSCRIAQRPTISEELYEPVRQAKQRVAELEKQIAELKKQKPKPTEQIESLTAEIRQLQTTTPYYDARSEAHTSALQSRENLICRL